MKNSLKVLNPVFRLAFTFLLVIFFIGIGSPLLAATKSDSANTGPRIFADQALQLELNGGGLDLAAAELKNASLQDIEDMPLPDVEDELSGGVKVVISGMTGTVHFDDLILTPENGYLQVDIALSDVEVFADKVQFKKRVLGQNISTTCRNTVIKMGQDEPLHLKSHLQIVVRGHELKVNADNIKFSIDSDNYDVDGPSRCSGGLGVGDLIRGMVHLALSSSKGAIERAVKDRVGDMAPQLEKQFNAQTHQRFTLDISGMPQLPTRTAEISSFPYEVKITSTGLTTTLGVSIVDVTADPLKTQLFFKDLKNWQERFGALGVNPAVATEAFQELFPHGSEYFELENSQAPGLRDALTIQSGASMWPDLNTLATEESYLRLAVRVASVPIIRVNESKQSLVFNIPKLELKFMIKHDGAWMDYFIMEVGVRGDIGSEINVNGQLRIGFQEAAHLTIDGHWAPEYQPTVPIFERDIAMLLFSSIFDYLYASGPLLEMLVPPVPVGDKLLTIMNPHVVDPFLRLELWGVSNY
jgi:hypothetical protein